MAYPLMRTFPRRVPMAEVSSTFPVQAFPLSTFNPLPVSFLYNTHLLYQSILVVIFPWYPLPKSYPHTFLSQSSLLIFLTHPNHLIVPSFTHSTIYHYFQNPILTHDMIYLYNSSPLIILQYKLHCSLPYFFLHTSIKLHDYQKTKCGQHKDNIGLQMHVPHDFITHTVQIESYFVKGCKILWLRLHFQKICFITFHCIFEYCTWAVLFWKLQVIFSHFNDLRK